MWVHLQLVTIGEITPEWPDECPFMEAARAACPGGGRSSSRSGSKAHGLAADARLPSELELADQYGVSRDTIRRAIQQLVNEGRVVVLHGRGTWVTDASGRR